MSFVEHCGIKMALNVPRVKRNPERQVGSCSSCYVLVEGSPSIFKGVRDLVRGVGCSQSDTSGQQQHPLTKHFTMLGICWWRFWTTYQFHRRWKKTDKTNIKSQVQPPSGPRWGSHSGTCSSFFLCCWQTTGPGEQQLRIQTRGRKEEELAFQTV